MSQADQTNTQRMDPAKKAEWVAALRSGDYVQGKSFLRNSANCFCCLGVLTDLAVKAGVGEWAREPTDSRSYYYGIDSGMLPAEVSAWAGFSYPARMGGEVFIDGHSDMLAGHNDCGKTFAQIADAIDAQL